MSGRRVLSFSTALLLTSSLVHAQTNTSPAHYDEVTLTPPALPVPKPTSVEVNLPTNPAGLSRTQNGDFMGFSVELSVTNQVLGQNLSKLSTNFVNLLAQIRKRAGHVVVRIGGNSQEQASIVNSVEKGKFLQKSNDDDSGNPTDTPIIKYTTELFDMMAKVSSYTGAGWYLGIPFDPKPNLDVAKAAPGILGGNLLGLQAANEPDFYASHHVRDDNYGPKDYFNELGDLIKDMKSQNLRTDNYLLAPSISLTKWSMDDIWDTGLVPAYKDSLGALTVERYLSTNCAKVGAAKPVDSQNLFNQMLQHKSVVDWVAPYYPSTALAQQNGKPFIMTEFNTATCSGLPGLSNSFGAALWLADAGLQMAYANFTGALLHVGGQESFYNPFTAPPTKDIKNGVKWTVSAPYYSSIVVAEALGSSNKSQVLDLGTDQLTPSYGIYEDGAPTRVVLFNYMTDNSGASDVTMNVKVPSSVSSVRVKYLKADSVASKDAFTWAGQTWGPALQSSGNPTGTEDVQTVSCASSACAVKVPAPGLALVFLTDKAYADSTSGEGVTGHFATASGSASASASKSSPTKKTAATGSTNADIDENSAVSSGVGFVQVVSVALLFVVSLNLW